MVRSVLNRLCVHALFRAIYRTSISVPNLMKPTCVRIGPDDPWKSPNTYSVWGTRASCGGGLVREPEGSRKCSSDLVGRRNRVASSEIPRRWLHDKTPPKAEFFVEGTAEEIEWGKSKSKGLIQPKTTTLAVAVV